MCALSTNDTRVEQRPVVKFLSQSGHTPIQCWRQLHDIYGNQTFSKNSVRVWHKKFQNGHSSTKDEKRSGWPWSTRTPEAVEAVRNQLGQDRRQTVHQLAEEVGLNKSTLHTILKSDLKLSKVAPKFIPRILTDKQKRFRMKLCQQNLDRLQQDNDFLSLIVSGDESWMSVFEVETKQQASEWVPKGDNSARLTKALRQRSTKKAMLTVFLDQQGPILAEFASPGTTIDTKLYCQVLRHLKENIRCKRPQLWTMKNGYWTFQLHHDNAPSHTLILTLAFIGESHIDIVAHLPYSPDLAICDFFVFPRIKSELRGHRFQNLRNMKTAVLRTLKSIPQQEIHQAFQTLPLRWMKCISAQGEYFEGHHLQVDPDDFGFELVWEDSDSEAE